jgi:phospholipase C
MGSAVGIASQTGVNVVKRKSLLLCVCLALMGLGVATPAVAGARPTASSPCGQTRIAPVYQHVIWVFMENHSYDTIIGSPDAPYANTLANECGLATNYHNITHPSLPNYIAATSGLPMTTVRNKFASDCTVSKTCRTAAPSIFGQVSSWKAYEESMPSNCSVTNSGNYAVRHNPPPYFRTLSGCSTNDVPYTSLSTDLANNTLPAFSFITPNLVDDTHNAGVATGDAWLSTNLQAIFDSPAYAAGTTAVVLTWDEGEGGTSNDCARNTTDIGCHIAAIVASPSTKAGTKSAKLFNHYSLLRTTEDLLGVPPLAKAVTAKSMAKAFNL